MLYKIPNTLEILSGTKDSLLENSVRHTIKKMYHKGAVKICIL